MLVIKIVGTAAQVFALLELLAQKHGDKKIADLEKVVSPSSSQNNAKEAAAESVESGPLAQGGGY